MPHKITHNIGFIGTGQMAIALAACLVKTQTIASQQLFGFDVNREAMLQFDDPEKAFIHSGEKVKRGGNAFLHLYHLDKRLRGFEVVVASSNNKAVENVSVELPGRGAVDDGCFPGGTFPPYPEQFGRIRIRGA